MLTGCFYRGVRLERVNDRGWTERWRVGDDPTERSWNDSILRVDSLSTGEPPERVVCAECGDIDLLTWSEQMKASLLSERLCFDCKFWSDLARAANATHEVAIIDGHHYTIRPDNQPVHGSFYGYAGRKFQIQFHDGHCVTTHNLWSQGDIPAHFRERLPDNACWAAAGKEGRE